MSNRARGSMDSRHELGLGLLFYSIALLAGVASLYLFFHRQIDTGFANIFGNEYDAVIEATLVSHWHHVLGLTQPWQEPPYFFPNQGVLGYNDGYLLYGLIEMRWTSSARPRYYQERRLRRGQNDCHS
jgi:hypothetical protein